MSRDRDTEAGDVELIKDPTERAAREAENGVRQFRLAEKIIVENLSKPGFQLRQGTILSLHEEALHGIHPLAGTFRNSVVTITKSEHIPPPHREVADLVSDMCAYVNEHWNDRSPIHLYSYVMWRLNWIHPFADGNGRTARTLGYVVMSVKMNSFLPGSPAMPDLIDADKEPYYKALEMADHFWKRDETVSLGTMENYLEGLLVKQLESGVAQAGL